MSCWTLWANGLVGGWIYYLRRERSLGLIET